MKCAIQDARVAILLNQQAQVGILKICIVPILLMMTVGWYIMLEVRQKDLG
jgi:hypothetical protein